MASAFSRTLYKYEAAIRFDKIGIGLALPRFVFSRFAPNSVDRHNFMLFVQKSIAERLKFRAAHAKEHLFYSIEEWIYHSVTLKVT